PALGRFWQKTIGSITRRSDIGIECLVTELRRQQAFFSSEIPMLRIHLVAALVVIRRGQLGREGVESQVLKLLWIEAKRDRGSLFGGQVQFELRIRVDRLQRGVALRRWKTVYGCAYEAIFHRLRESE